MVLVDSTVWIDHLRGQVSEKTEKLRSLLADEDVVCIWVIVQEILQYGSAAYLIKTIRTIF
jgi:predicted nucleic acid-binding protein